MATCKDCIHHDICTFADDIRFQDDICEHCDNFKDKSRCIEVVRCGNCRWWTKQEDSAQGRCELGGFYPNGEWYCANGERKEYVEELKEMKLKGRRNDTQGVI